MLLCVEVLGAKTTNFLAHGLSRSSQVHLVVLFKAHRQGASCAMLGRQGPKRQLFGLIHNFFPPPHTLPSFSEIQRICFRFGRPRIGLFIVWPQ